MPEKKSIVINTGPILALIAGIGNLNVLETLYHEVYITKEVKDELLFKGTNSFGAKEFMNASFLIQVKAPMILSPILKNSLDPGEASVIQFALDNTIPLVCIDEVVGRRKARLYDLTVTGSLGIMLRAKKEGVNLNLAGAIDNMKKNGIYLSNEVIKKALIIEKSIKDR